VKIDTVEDDTAGAGEYQLLDADGASSVNDRLCAANIDFVEECFVAHNSMWGSGVNNAGCAALKYGYSPEYTI